MTPWLRRAALLTLPALVGVGVDIWQRGAQLAAFSTEHRWAYLGAWLEALIVWGLLLTVTFRTQRWLRAGLSLLFVLAYSLTLGGQLYFYGEYRSYLNRDLSIFAAGMLESVLGQLWADGLSYVSYATPFAVVAVILLGVAHRWLDMTPRQTRKVVIVAPAVVVGAWFMPVQHRQVQAAPPDSLYFNSIGGFIASQFGLTEASTQTRPRARASLPIVGLRASPSRQRNIVFVLTESTRADAACAAYSASCRRTPYTNELLPERLPLNQLRALDSTTAVSLAVLWSGIAPNESRDVLHSWPLLFDYANAAGWDTAFWTSQNLMFGNSRLWVKNLGARLFVSGSELEPTSDLDLGADEHLLAEHVIDNWSQLSEPFFVTLQLSNTHYPYLVNSDLPQPFQPAAFDKSEEGQQRFRNYYQNSVVQQDLHLARMLRALKESPVGPRTVIVYTSDHGEAFRDHHQMGHTFSLFDEEIKVPGFIDAPPGTLTQSERRHLVSKADALTFHSDFAPTMLDLMGVWDAPAITDFKAKMVGTSLLREPLTESVLAMTNCSGVWSCAFENWGVMQGRWKLFARTPYDTGWQCYDVLADPKEENRATGPQCDALQRKAVEWFGELPR